MKKHHRVESIRLHRVVPQISDIDSEYLDLVKQSRDEQSANSRKSSVKTKSLLFNNLEVAVRNFEQITLKAKRETGLNTFFESDNLKSEQRRDLMQPKWKSSMAIISKTSELENLTSSSSLEEFETQI